MKNLFIILLATITMAFNSSEYTIHSFRVKTIEGNDYSFANLKGKKIMVVNTASECGFTPQYKDLEALYQKYKDKNFIIVGFPCNDFGKQEPGTNADIKAFCTKNYGVTFPMMEKMSIATSPIYQWLTHKNQNGVMDVTVKWNFNKFLINEDGSLAKHLPSSAKPMDTEITKWIEG